MQASRPFGPGALSSSEMEIRRTYRERATFRWFVAVVVGIALVIVALGVGTVGTTALAVVGAYSLVTLLMALRSAVLLARLRR